MLKEGWITTPLPSEFTLNTAQIILFNFQVLITINSNLILKTTTFIFTVGD